MNSIIKTHPLTSRRIEDLERLFSCDRIVDDCWCMWNIIRVVDFHAAGRTGNHASFLRLLKETPEPLGVLAYAGNEPVGWCAVGPRSRYLRILKTPTLKGRDASEDNDVWLITCFFAKDGAPANIVADLMQGAVDLAKKHGAKAIEGFPDAAGKRSDRGARGAERWFEKSGFSVDHRPSSGRVIMRKEFAKGP